MSKTPRVERMPGRDRDEDQQEGEDHEDRRDRVPPRLPRPPVPRDQESRSSTTSWGAVLRQPQHEGPRRRCHASRAELATTAQAPAMKARS